MKGFLFPALVEDRDSSKSPCILALFIAQHPHSWLPQDIVLAAVGNDGMALQEASPELQQDRAVLLKAICQLKGRWDSDYERSEAIEKHIEQLKAKLAIL